jgi:hypothetical protein
MWISGDSGASYGAEMPVKSLIIPARAFLYRPLGSRCSATSTGMSTNTSMNGIALSPFWVAVSCISLAICRSALYGEMNEVNAIVEASAKSFATYAANCSAIVLFEIVNSSHTSPILLMFSFRSFSEKPKSLFKPNRTLSPSSLYADKPRCRRCCSSAVAMVDFPDAERPVNQMVRPRWPRSSLRSCRDKEGCQVMFLFQRSVTPPLYMNRTGDELYVAIVSDPICQLLRRCKRCMSNVLLRKRASKYIAKLRLMRR